MRFTRLLLEMRVGSKEYDPETKQQSTIWLFPGEAPTKSEAVSEFRQKNDSHLCLPEWTYLHNSSSRAEDCNCSLVY